MKHTTLYYESNNTNFITKLFQNTYDFFYKKKIEEIKKEKFKEKVLNTYLEKTNKKFLSVEEKEFIQTLQGTRFYKMLLINLCIFSPFQDDLISFAHKKQMLQ